MNADAAKKKRQQTGRGSAFDWPARINGTGLLRLLDYYRRLLVGLLYRLLVHYLRLYNLLLLFGQRFAAILASFR